MSTLDIVFEKLREIKPPYLKADILTGGLVQDVSLDKGELKLHLKIPEEIWKDREKLADQTKTKLMEIEGITQVTINKELLKEPTEGRVPFLKRKIQGIKNTILIASGKGGVGKSTVSVNLALALRRLNASVGVMDGDIYGPTIPKMMGLERTPISFEGESILPQEKYGIKFLSIGFFLDKGAPVIWRGPLIQKAYFQFLFDTNWGELDFLLVDLPPGTGDAQITLAQSLDTQGAIAITTPQEVSLIDVERAVSMFRRMGVDILGVIENMSYFQCDNCGKIHELFGSQGGERLSKSFGVPLLGRIPLDLAIMNTGERGESLFDTKREEIKDIFLDIARRIQERIGVG